MRSTSLVRQPSARARLRSDRAKILACLVLLCTVVLVLLVRPRQAQYGVSSEEKKISTNYFDKVARSASGSTALVAKDPANAARVAILVMQSIVDDYRHEMRFPAILETWGELSRLRSNGMELIFLSCWVPKTWADEGLMALCPPESLGKGKTKKLMWALEALSRREPAYEYVLKVDDITFVLAKNLRAYLDELSAKVNPRETPLLIGNILAQSSKGPVFPSGGAGILMTNAFLQQCVKSPPVKHPQNEDLGLSECATSPSQMLSATSPEGGELFNVFGPVRTLRKDLDSWYKEYKASAVALGSSLSTSPVVSASLITFHYVEYQVANFLHELLTKGHTAWTAKALLNAFPKHGVGGYERSPSTPEEAERLLDVARTLAKHY